MNAKNEDSMVIVIELLGLHPTFARQVRLMAKQIETWFGWKHIAFVLELVECGPYVAEDRSSTWQVDEAKKFATKAEAISWCGNDHINRGGLVIERSLVEKDGERKTLDLFEGDHSLLETNTPGEWLQNMQEARERFAASGLVVEHGDTGDIGARVISIHPVERPPASDTNTN